MPAPRTTEHHPLGYPYRERFPNLQPYLELEGATVYVAEERGTYCVVTNEWLVAELLGEELDAVTIHVFDTREDRDAYCVDRWRGRAGRA